MRFLCGAHRQQLARLEGQSLEDRWFDWMGTGGLYYALGQWRQCVPQVGCAFDLAADALADGRMTPRDGGTRLALSTIYLAEALTRLGDDTKARFALACGLARLSSLLRRDGDPWLRHCREVVADPELRCEFFRAYLNLPLEAP